MWGNLIVDFIVFGFCLGEEYIQPMGLFLVRQSEDESDPVHCLILMMFFLRMTRPLKQCSPKIPTVWLTVFLKAKSGTIYLIRTKGGLEVLELGYAGSQNEGAWRYFFGVYSLTMASYFYELTKFQSLVFPIMRIHSSCARGCLLFSQLFVISSVWFSFTGFSVIFMYRFISQLNDAVCGYPVFLMTRSRLSS